MKNLLIVMLLCSVACDDVVNHDPFCERPENKNASECVQDKDGDGVSDGSDNCPDVQNPDQVDQDADGTGDACDDLIDSDDDKVADADDNCPKVANNNQADADGDGIGDACEPDSDEDGVIDDNDNCPNRKNPQQEDADGDGIGDFCEPDGDQDGIIDDLDNCPSINNPQQNDRDGDGTGDVCADPDSDGLTDNVDNCPDDANSDQLDADIDGIGNECDPTFDGSTIYVVENFTDTLIRINYDNTTTTIGPTNLGFIREMTYWPHLGLFVAIDETNSTVDRLVTINPLTGAGDVFFTPTANMPQRFDAITVDPATNILYLTSGSSLYSFDYQGSQVPELIGSTTSPRGMAWDPTTNKIWFNYYNSSNAVSDTGIIDPADGSYSYLGNGLNYSRGMTIYNDELYVLQAGANSTYSSLYTVSKVNGFTAYERILPPDTHAIATW